MTILSFTELRETIPLSIEDAAEILGVTPKTIYRWERGEIVPKRAFISILESMLHKRQQKRK